MAYHCVDGRFLGEAANVARRHTQDHGKVGRIRNRQAVAKETAPDELGLDLAHHGSANDGQSKMPSHEVSARVLKVGGSHSANEDEDELEDVAQSLDKERVQGAEAEAFDDNRAKLGQVSVSNNTNWI